MGYEEFSVSSPREAETCHCRFHTLTIGISPRHSDTVDVKFLVNGKGIVLALPHTAFAEFRRQTGRSLTDSDAIQIAGLFLKGSLERGDPLEEPLLQLSVEETLELARRIQTTVSS